MVEKDYIQYIKLHKKLTSLGKRRKDGLYLIKNILTFNIINKENRLIEVYRKGIKSLKNKRRNNESNNEEISSIFKDI